MKGPFSLRRGSGGGIDGGGESSGSAAPNYMDLSSIVPGAAASSTSAPSRHSGPKKSLRGAPVKPPAPVVDDDDDDGARHSVRSRSSFQRPSVGSTFSMAGAAAISLRKSLRRDTGEQAPGDMRRATPVHSYTPEPEAEGGWTPRPPSGARPANRAPRPGQQAIPVRRSQPTTSTGSATPIEDRQSFGTTKQSWMGRFNAPVGWTSTTPVQPRPPEETAPAAPVVPDDVDEMRLSNFSVKSSHFNSRSKSTPSRGRQKAATSTAQSSTDEHGEAGVIKKTLRPGRRSAARDRQLDHEREERDSCQSRATGTFTSHGTGTMDSRMTHESRGTFNFGDENPDDDDEAMLQDPLAAF